MPNAILFGIVCVIALGSLAQWLAWRFRVPSILLLLVFGFVAGPVTGPDLLLDPGALREADWVFAFTSLSIGVILFEGGLTLRLRELREVGHAALYLITLGVLLTWAMAGAAAYYLLGFPPGLAVLTGAILTVTGPTVVVPLLRHVRPAGRVGALAKWEGITIDPVGAILAVLVLETLLFINEPGAHGGEYGAALHTAKGVLRTLFISVGVSITGALILIDLIRRRLMPDFLVNPIALTVVIGAFSISNLLQHESGLLTTTLIGIFLANQSYASMRRIEEFKEDLQVLLIAALFIVLSARLEMSALQYIDGQALLFLGALIVLVRPISVFLSLMGTRGRRERPRPHYLSGDRGHGGRLRADDCAAGPLAGAGPAQPAGRAVCGRARLGQADGARARRAGRDGAHGGRQPEDRLAGAPRGAARPASQRAQRRRHGTARTERHRQARGPDAQRRGQLARRASLQRDLRERRGPATRHAYRGAA
ncbi:MAG: hypothetical protein BRD45_03735 [Bacteroidetes bacterium QS_8_64_10]|nr:MAG: hypothetical protein BRD45_03735 [Bacteroidetes bacterium QS_8_64_10]